MIRRLGHALTVLCLTGAAAQAGPSTIPASLKTLESVLSSVDLPSPSVGAGVQPLHNAVAAADGLLGSLDPHGLSGASSERPHSPSEEDRTGLILNRMKGYPTIAGTLPGSPAHRTSLREGDRLLAIGDEEVAADDSLVELQHKLAGQGEEEVELQVLHADRRGVATYKVTPTTLNSRVHVRTLTGGVAYVQITGPTAMTLAEYRLKLGQLSREGLIGVVLDLRAVHRGGAEEGVGLVEPFLGPGEVATVLEKDKESVLRTSKPAAITVPLVVVVGPATRGAGEIAAGALQARRRAVLLGGDTQGWAPSYRQVEKAGVFLTVPSRLIQLSSRSLLTGKGLRPDIVVDTEAVPSSLAESFSTQLDAFAEGVKWEPPKDKSETDKNLDAALEEEDGSEDGDSDEESSDEGEDKDEASAEAARDPFHDYALVKRYDPRLVRSVHLLMAAHIFSRQKLN